MTKEGGGEGGIEGGEGGGRGGPQGSDGQGGTGGGSGILKFTARKNSLVAIEEKRGKAS